MNILRALLWGILWYYVVLHALYLLLVLIGGWQLRRYRRGIPFAEFQRIAKSPLTMPITLIIPAYNEAAIIAHTVRNASTLHYPLYEIVVVNDGSKDATMAELKRAFRLRPVDKHGPRHLETQEVLGVYESPDLPNLIVVDKKNGRRADAINAAVTLSSYPLLCIIDADCVVDSDALLHLVRPFLRDTHIAAVAGIVRPSNGLTVENGQITHCGLPQTLLGMNQEIEYARSFQWARIGLCRLQSMLCISGALMLIRKTVFEVVGGSSATAICDDIEFTIRLNAYVHDRRKKDRARLAYVPDAVCYTEVPEKWRLYASQRNRWQRGTLQALLRNWRMILNPRYGLTGLFGMPFFLLFEALSAVVEMAAWVLMVVCLIVGVATVWEVLLMLYVAYALNVFLSLSAILLTETTFLRASNWRDLWRILVSIFLDSLGFHQFHLATRVVGTVQFLLLGRRDLGATIDRIVPRTA